MAESPSAMPSAPEPLFYRKPVFLAAAWAWLLFVVLFAVRAPSIAVNAAGALVLICSIALMRISPRYALYLLPAACTAGPAIRATIPGLGKFDLSDGYLLLLLMFYAGWAQRHRVATRLGPYRQAFAVGGVLVILSWALSREITVSLPGLINAVQLMLVYLLTLNLLRNEQDLRDILGSWAAVSLVCSIWVAWNYQTGQQLLLGLNEADILVMESAKSRSDGLYKATHFYAGFFYVPLVGTIIAVCSLITRRRRWALAIVWPLVTIASNLLCILLLGRRTALIAMAIVLTTAAAWRLLAPIPGARRRHRGLLVVPVLFAMVATVGWVLPEIVTEEQQSVYGDYMRDDRSLRMRFPIWVNALESLGLHPKAMLVGVGPNMSARIGPMSRDPVLDEILENPLTGRREGAVDNTYLTVALELGLPVLLIMLFIGIDTVRRLGARVIGQMESSPVIRLCIITWMVAGVAQITGLSKPTWLLAQLVACAHVMISKLANVRRAERSA